MTQKSNIIFVCEHGAAKSVIAAAYFNKLAAERGMDLRAIARGTHPDEVLSPKAVAGLLEDGLQPAEKYPQKLQASEAESAKRIITFCKLPDDLTGMTEVEEWDGVPPVSDDYQVARSAIVEHLEHLMTEIK